MGHYSEEELRAIRKLNGYHLAVANGLDGESLKKIYKKVCHIKTGREYRIAVVSKSAVYYYVLKASWGCKGTGDFEEYKTMFGDEVRKEKTVSGCSASLVFKSKCLRYFK
jgi:hypothetical protein